MGYLELHGWVGDWSRSSQWPLRHGHPSLPCGYQPSRPIIRILLGPYHTSQLYKEHQDTSRALRIPTYRTCDLFIKCTLSPAISPAAANYVQESPIPECSVIKTRMAISRKGKELSEIRCWQNGFRIKDFRILVVWGRVWPPTRSWAQRGALTSSLSIRVHYMRRKMGSRRIGPRTVGPRGPTVQGPTVQPRPWGRGPTVQNKDLPSSIVIILV